MAGKFPMLRAGILAMMILFSPGLFTRNACACTAFVMPSEEGAFLAKNLDWPLGEGLLIVNKRGVWKKAYIEQGRRLSWISTYGSITFNQFGKEFPLGGMNEMGLVVEELNLYGDAPRNDTAYQLNEYQWVQYCLDNFSTVEELLTGSEGIALVPVFQMLHYLVCDRNGHAAVVEFFQGEMHIYDGNELPYPVLSNDRYENLVKYSWNFKGFGGDMPIRRETTAGERFLRVAALLNEDGEWKKSDPVEAAFSILDTVSQEDTRWSIVYDAAGRTVYYRTNLSRTVKSIDLTGFDFSCETALLCMDILNDSRGKINGLFADYSEEANVDLVKRVYDQYKQEGHEEVWENKLLEMASYGNSMGCP
jgi:choloylglycine hydrolase